MPSTISQSFIKEYEAEVHVAYQRMGSRLRPTVRNKVNVKGSHAIFQRIGKGAAEEKDRHGMVPVMHLDHTPVECQLRDYYAGEWVDALDELKIEHDERQVLVNAGAYALGRKTDELIITALNDIKQDASNSDGVIAVANSGLTLTKVLQAFELLGQQDVPDDGERYAIISWRQWSDLLRIPEFASSEFVGSQDLPWQGAQARRWLGTLWLAHSGLPLVAATKVRTCFWYHKTAVGHASGSDVVTDISWHGDHAAHFVASRMSQGAQLIDRIGVVAIDCKES